MELIIMASIYASARKSTTSVFDVVTITAETLTSTLRMGARTVNILDERVELLHASVSDYCTAERTNVRDDAIVDAATRHLEKMEELHYKLNPSVQFDRIACYNEAVAKITSAFEEKEKGE